MDAMAITTPVIPERLDEWKAFRYALRPTQIPKENIRHETRTGPESTSALQLRWIQRLAAGGGEYRCVARKRLHRPDGQSCGRVVLVRRGRRHLRLRTGSEKASPTSPGIGQMDRRDRECINPPPKYAAEPFGRVADYPSRWETPSFASYCSAHHGICSFTIETPYGLIGDLLLTRERYREAGERIATGIVETLCGTP